jgi:predicted peroxiredoxin
MEYQPYPKIKSKSKIIFFILLTFGTLNLSIISEQSNLVFSPLKIQSSDNPFQLVEAQETDMTTSNKTKLVYHLSSDEPWRATIALLDSQTMLKMGYNVTLMLSIEGVQLGVKDPHHYLGLESLTRNVTDFIYNGGTVIICEVCLKIAGYNNSDVINGSIIGTPSIMANLLNQTTVVDY